MSTPNLYYKKVVSGTTSEGTTLYTSYLRAGEATGYTKFESGDGQTAQLGTMDVEKVVIETPGIVLPADCSELLGSSESKVGPILTIEGLDYLENWDTSNVTNMYSIFGQGVGNINTKYRIIQDLDLSKWDVSNVTNMGCAFLDFAGSNLNLSAWNTSSVTSMNGMFRNCYNLSSLDISHFDTSNVTSLAWMFGFISINCSEPISLDLSSWNVSNVTNIESLFYGANVETLDLANWSISKIDQMCYIFDQCDSLKWIDMTSFDTSNVTEFYDTFYGCVNLEHIYVGEKWSTAQVTYYHSVFGGDVKLPNFDSSQIGIEKAYYGGDGKGYLEKGPGPEYKGSIYLKVSGVWKKATAYQKISGAWKKSTVYKKISGGWKK